MVPRDHQTVARQNRGTSRLTHVGKHLLLAEMLLPEQVPCHVVGIQAARFEEGVDTLTVGDGRTRSPGAVLHRGLARALFAGGSFPDNASGTTVDRQDDEPMDVSRLDLTSRLMRRDALHAHRDGGEQEEPIAPHHG
jgi:hypothetical protein